MKRLLLITLTLLLLSSCSGHSDLFKQTDYFVNQLTYTYSSYGLSGLSHKRYTSDGKYGVFPTGRLINVRIEEYASSEEYDKLCKALKRHYKNNPYVNDVYICGGGTIMIDCRN